MLNRDKSPVRPLFQANIKSYQKVHKSKDKNRLDISVDCVVFGFDNNLMKVLTINYEKLHAAKSAPVALPGDLILEDEDLECAAQRILKELTGLDGIYLKQLGAFGHPERTRAPKDQDWLKATRSQPENRVVTIAYYALIKMEDYSPRPSSFAKAAEWIDVEKVPPMAFDHDLILKESLAALRRRFVNHDLCFELLPEKFTLSQLQTIHEIVLGVELDKRNFRKSMKNLAHVIPLDEKQKGAGYKPAQLFKWAPLPSPVPPRKMVSRAKPEAENANN